MALTATMLKRSKTSGVYTVIFGVVASGSYTTGGDVVNFALKAGYTNRQPDFITISGNAGYIYKYNQATTAMLVYIPTAVSGNTGFAQHSAAAYDATVIADTIRAMCIWIATPGLTT